MKKLTTLLGVFLMVGCATIVDGGPDTINIMTGDGSKATAQVFSKYGAQTIILPTVYQAQKSCKDIAIHVQEDNKIQSSYAVANSSINPWVLGNIFLGGFIGLGIDAIAGNVCTYQNHVVVPITKK